MQRIEISAHAIIRYLERCYGLDIKKIEKEILPDKTRVMLEAMGADAYTVNGMHFRVANGVVVTGYKKSKSYKNKKQRHVTNKRKKKR